MPVTVSIAALEATIHADSVRTYLARGRGHRDLPWTAADDALLAEGLALARQQ